MKYTQTPVPDILDVFMLKGDQAMLHDTINILFQVCVELLLESISCIIILWMLEKVLLFHILSSCCKYSLHLVSKLIQASKSTFSFSDHTTESLLTVHRSLLRLLLKPSVKFIAILWTLILLPISILYNNFPCMHSPSYSSILSRCIHVQVSTTIVKITLAHIQVPKTFFMYLLQVLVSSIQMCILL